MRNWSLFIEIFALPEVKVGSCILRVRSTCTFHVGFIVCGLIGCVYRLLVPFKLGVVNMYVNLILKNVGFCNVFFFNLTHCV